MDSSDDEERHGGAAADDSQLDVDHDAMDALLEEEIAAAMQADSDEQQSEAGQSSAGSSSRRAINGELLSVDEQKDGVARKRPTLRDDAEELKGGELDSDLEEEAAEDRAEQSVSSAASLRAAVPAEASAAALSASRRRNNRENYQRREQRRRLLEMEQSRIRATLPSAAAVKRYDTFRRARLSHSTLKSLIQQCTGSNKVEGQLPAVLSAMGRVYVGAIVEEARRAMRAMGHSGNIRPMHLREAHRRLADRGDIIVPNCSDGRRRGIGVAGWHRNGQFFRELG